MTQTRRELGEVLLEQGLVTHEQLSFADAEEAKTGRSAWKIMLERGMVNERDLVRARAAQIGMEFVDVASAQPGPEAIALVPEELARRQKVLPVVAQEGVLLLAVADPRNHLAVEEVARVSSLRVVAAVAFPQDLVTALDRFYAAAPPVLASSLPLDEVPAPAVSAEDFFGAPPLDAASMAPSLQATENGHALEPAALGAFDAGAPPTAAPEPPAGPTVSVEKEDQPKDPNLAEFLMAVLEGGGSDLHLTAGLPPMIRVNGEVEPVAGYRRLMPQDLQEILYSMLTQKQREMFEDKLELDVSYSLPGKARFRVNVFQQRDALGSVMRLIPYEIKTVEELGLPPAVREFASLRRGLVLVTGITGSGKSTTLAALIDWINANRAEHIMTVEDPIEFLHQHKRAIVNQREVGTDTYSFAEALKRVLRQDPDVILVGEMRDLETISTALTAAETGHLVFGTLHTQDAPQSVDRVIDVFPPHQQQQIRVQLASSLAGVVSQQLLPVISGKGRAVAAEILVATPAVRNLIREGKTHQIYTSMQSGGKFGMQVMDFHLAELVKRNQVSYEIALERCHKPEEFNRLAGRG